MAIKDTIKNAFTPGPLTKDSADMAGKLIAGRRAPKSIAGMARSSIFEFPAFISSSVDYKYAEATCNLLELTYASWLQMAISQNPIYDATEENPDPFAHWKTDTNNYLECSNLTHTFDACHNVIVEGDTTFEFNLVSISDRTGEIINEAVEYEPLSEFDHYFQEAVPPPPPRPKTFTPDQMKSTKSQSNEFEYEPGAPGVVQVNGRGDAIVKSTTNTEEPSEFDVAMNNARYHGQELSNRQTEQQIQAFAHQEARLNEAQKIEQEKLKILQDRNNREAGALENDPEYKEWKKRQEELAKERAEYEARVRKYCDDNGIPPEIQSLAEIRQYEARMKAQDLADYGKKRSFDIRKSFYDTAVKAPELMDESKIQKLNSLKPLTMTVQLMARTDIGESIPDQNGKKIHVPDIVTNTRNLIAGVKIYSRLVKAEILPEVAEFPIKEMNNLSRNIRWKAGELKFFKDILFRIDTKKQTAVDSHDPDRKWYRRLYELAHTANDSASVDTLTKGKTGIFERMMKSFTTKLFGKDPKDPTTKSGRGFIPNATIIISKEDVDNIHAETGIDLLKGSKATEFCRQLFLMNFVVIDVDAQTIKTLTPDQHKDFEIHTLASIEKQLSMIDSAAVTSREIFKALKK